jgi:hypothetical protein
VTNGLQAGTDTRSPVSKIDLLPNSDNLFDATSKMFPSKRELPLDKDHLPTHSDVQSGTKLPPMGAAYEPMDLESSSNHQFISVDGTSDRWGKRRKLPVSAIFIHAGAGYHSAANELVHLKACNE